MINKNINTRVLITIPKELKEQLEQSAKEDNRSFSNYVVKILKEYIKNNI